MSNPLDELAALGPVSCSYPGCNEGPFKTGTEIDEHVCEVHLTEAVWDFAYSNMRASPQQVSPLSPSEPRSRDIPDVIT